MTQNRILYTSSLWLCPLLCLHSVNMNMSIAIKFFTNQTLQLTVSQTYWHLYFAIWTHLLELYNSYVLVKTGHLKGQCLEIFDFWFFSWISFPQAPEYTIRAVSIFFENSRRYSQLKVHHGCQRHRWQIEKIFNQKNFNYFAWTALGCRVNIYINFFLQVHFQL